jgi:hypothetical protein
MEIASWMISSMAPAVWSGDHPEDVSRRMRPAGTHAYPRDDCPELWAGQTTWAWHKDGVWHAVGWDWIELQRDVLVLADPMALVSNLQFAGHEQNEVGERQRILLLNSIVYLLPWQEQVRRGLGRSSRGSALLVAPKFGSVIDTENLALAA